MKFIQFVQNTAGPLSLSLLGTSTDLYVAAYQKFIILLLSSSQEAYRSLLGGNLLRILQGANISLDALNQIGPLACSTALNQLDPTDKQLIKSAKLVLLLDPLAIAILLTFKDNTSIVGRL